MKVHCKEGYWLSHNTEKTSYTLTCEKGGRVTKKIIQLGTIQNVYWSALSFIVCRLREGGCLCLHQEQ